MRRMTTLADCLVSQAIKIGTLERKVAVLRAAQEPNHKEQAEAILRSMNEEAANLQPRFTSLERDLLVQGLTRLVEDGCADHIIVKDLIATVLDMHVTDAFTRMRA